MKTITLTIDPEIADEVFHSLRNTAADIFNLASQLESPSQRENYQVKAKLILQLAETLEEQLP